ncbi:RNA-binding protein 41-like isoform X2 [Cloeon dipterum]
MANISNRASKIFREMGLEEDGPEPDNSETQSFIKELAQKQLSKHTSLSEQLSFKQDFIQGSNDEFSSIELPAGLAALDRFSASTSQLSFDKLLLSRGIAQEELDFFYDLKKGRQYLKSKYAKLEPTALDRKISLVINKVKVATSFNTSGSSSSPQESNSTHYYPPNHPMNQLKEIEVSLFGHLRKSPEQMNEGFKVQKRKIEENEPVSYLAEGESQWDKKKQKKYQLPQKAQATTASLKTCAPKTFYTIKDGKTVFLGRTAPPEVPPQETLSKPTLGKPYVAPHLKTTIPLEIIKTNSLPIAEIRKITKFQNYEKGTPSRTLFLKNLSGLVLEKDLAELFGNFEQEGSQAIVYRLMGGRMKGQAFVKFPDEKTAERALDCVIGYQLKGRPIIIQFGKESSAS